MANYFTPSAKYPDRETKEVPEGAIMHESVGGVTFMHVENGVVVHETNDYSDGSGESSTIYSTPQQARELAEHYKDMAYLAETGNHRRPGIDDDG